MAKKKSSRKSESADTSHLEKKVDFKPETKNSQQKTKVGGLKPSPSVNTLNRIERDGIVLWKRPFTTTFYAIMEILHLAVEFLHGLAQQKVLLFVLSAFSAVVYYFYIMPGPHQEFIQSTEKRVLWWAWWVFLGVLSSIGFGSGLHTFLIYLGPHIAAVTLATYECNSVDFPEPPYPESIVCPDEKNAVSNIAITLWNIVAKVRVESFLWGAGTALGELPPYFMARAARLSGEEPDDEEYKEFLEIMHGDKKNMEMSLMDRCKAWVEQTVSKVGFPGILIFASVPNPFFDLAGITCGHFLVPFWTFFGATLIGKAVIKMHVQMLFVIVAFSEHHVDHLLSLLGKVPKVGNMVRQPFKELIANQRAALHRTPGTHVEHNGTLLQTILSGIVTFMIFGFLLSIFSSLAQSYHKRLCAAKKQK